MLTAVKSGDIEMMSTMKVCHVPGASGCVLDSLFFVWTWRRAVVLASLRHWALRKQ
jgi:hypothetical protein